MHKKLLTLGLTTLGLLTTSVSADAALINFYYTGTDVTASGQLTTDTEGTTITGISGERNGVAINSLLPPGSYPLEVPNDNVFIPSNLPAFLTYNGLSYQTTEGSNYNLYYDDDLLVPLYTEVFGDEENLVRVTATFTSVPEPSMVLGTVVILGLGALSRKKS